MPASSFFQQALQILPRRSHQGFTINPLQLSQANPSHAMPVLTFREERFHPHTALTESFLVGLGRLIGTYPIQILLIYTATETSSLLIASTLAFQFARVTLL